jgi:hypothetical protein
MSQMTAAVVKINGRSQRSGGVTNQKKYDTCFFH